MECEMPQINSNKEEIKAIFEETKTIAIIGCSPKVEKDSNRVAVYLKNHGFNIIPGMPVSAFIKTGETTLMRYLMLPFIQLSKGIFNAN